MIDSYDNGIIPAESSDFSINRVIGNFNPTWLEQEASDDAFLKAFEVAKQIFDREIERAKALKSSKASDIFIFMKRIFHHNETKAL